MHQHTWTCIHTCIYKHTWRNKSKCDNMLMISESRWRVIWVFNVLFFQSFCRSENSQNTCQVARKSTTYSIRHLLHGATEQYPTPSLGLILTSRTVVSKSDTHILGHWLKEPEIWEENIRISINFFTHPLKISNFWCVL